MGAKEIRWRAGARQGPLRAHLSARLGGRCPWRTSAGPKPADQRVRPGIHHDVGHPGGPHAHLAPARPPPALAALRARNGGGEWRCARNGRGRGRMRTAGGRRARRTGADRRRSGAGHPAEGRPSAPACPHLSRGEAGRRACCCQPLPKEGRGEAATLIGAGRRPAPMSVKNPISRGL